MLTTMINGIRKWAVNLGNDIHTYNVSTVDLHDQTVKTP